MSGVELSQRKAVGSNNSSKKGARKVECGSSPEVCEMNFLKRIGFPSQLPKRGTRCIAGPTATATAYTPFCAVIESNGGCSSSVDLHLSDHHISLETTCLPLPLCTQPNKTTVGNSNKRKRWQFVRRHSSFQNYSHELGEYLTKTELMVD